MVPRLDLSEVGDAFEDDADRVALCVERLRRGIHRRRRRTYGARAFLALPSWWAARVAAPTKYAHALPLVLEDLHPVGGVVGAAPGAAAVAAHRWDKLTAPLVALAIVVAMFYVAVAGGAERDLFDNYATLE